MILLFGAVLPTIILIPLLLWTFDTLAAIDPRARPADLVVDVVGKQWWWEIRYRDTIPSRTFTTANELHIPVGRRVELRLTSTDVIHSFWVPELQGKTDLIPGRENVSWIEASRPGEYGGQCAEFCGVQHATMGLLVVAQPEAEYERWAASQRGVGGRPTRRLGTLPARLRQLPHGARHAGGRPSSAPISPTSRAAARSPRDCCRTRPGTWADGSPTRRRSSRAAACPGCR